MKRAVSLVLVIAAAPEGIVAEDDAVLQDRILQPHVAAVGRRCGQRGGREADGQDKCQYQGYSSFQWSWASPS